MSNFKTGENLIPNIVNPSPDYFCTWQVQLYATNDGKPDIQRHAINEKSMFDSEKPYGWAYFYESARKDLFFVMDSSWDVPYDDAENRFRGCQILNTEKFPSFAKDGKSPVGSIKNLAQKVKELGWKGLGCWIASQECDMYVENGDVEGFWKTRLKWANEAGISYWKVDNGIKRNDFEFRKKLAEDAHKYAPNLFLENAVNDDVIPYSDLFRTYDVLAIMSIPMTLEKIADKKSIAAPAGEFSGILNCEDEAYIAAALGLTMGIMRHPYAGNFVNGKADMSFPQIHRNLKTKLTEVTRAVNWHKIAPAYTFNSSFMTCSEQMLYDTWEFQNPDDEIESWWLDREFMQDSLSKDGKKLTRCAPSIICRNMALPRVETCGDDAPYVIASKNPNGVISVATLGRTIGRKYEIPKCNVIIEADMCGTFGVFGEYDNLVLRFSESMTMRCVFAQDLADNVSYDITDSVKFLEQSAVIPGEIIHKIGTISQGAGDTSEPGLVIKFV